MSESLDRSGETPARRAAEAMTDAQTRDLRAALAKVYGEDWWFMSLIDQLLEEVHRLRRVSAPQDPSGNLPTRSAEAADERQRLLRAARACDALVDDLPSGYDMTRVAVVEAMHATQEVRALLAAAPPSALPTAQAPEVSTRSSETLDELREIAGRLRKYGETISPRSKHGVAPYTCEICGPLIEMANTILAMVVRAEGTTPDDALVALQRLSEAATPGEWATGWVYHCRTCELAQENGRFGVRANGHAVSFVNHPDAELIAAAVNYVRALLAPRPTAPSSDREEESDGRSGGAGRASTPEAR